MPTQEAQGTVVVDLLDYGVDLTPFKGETIIKIPGDWRIVSVVREYANPYLANVDVTYETPKGQEQKSLCLRRSAPVVLLMTGGFADRKIRVIDQFRHGAGQIVTELPGGMHQPGETDRECAAREVREEAGIDVEPEDLVDLGILLRDPARSPGLEARVFLYEVPATAKVMAPTSEPGEHIEGGTWLSLAEALQHLLGDKVDAVLAGALGKLLALPYVK